MYGIRGGLAAFAPLALFAHGGAPAVLLPGLVRVLRHHTGRAAASVTALAAGVALAIPTVGALQAPVTAAQPPPPVTRSHHQHPALRPRPRPAAAPRHPPRRHFHGDEDDADAFVRYAATGHRHHHAPRDSDRPAPRRHHGPGRHGRGHAYGHRRHDHRRRGHCDAAGPPAARATMIL